MEKIENQVPLWQKYTLSVQETAEYFGISDKKIRSIIEEHSCNSLKAPIE